MRSYPLVNVYIAMERSTILNGKIHYFDWAIFNCYVSSPEGNLNFKMAQAYLLQQVTNIRLQSGRCMAILMESRWSDDSGRQQTETFAYPLVN